MNDEPKRSKETYATADGSLALTVDWPFGLIAPPTIELYRPMVGPVTFYMTSCYTGIVVAADALTRSDSDA
jgi:hypothetical protein